MRGRHHWHVGLLRQTAETLEVTVGGRIGRWRKERGYKGKGAPPWACTEAQANGRQPRTSKWEVTAGVEGEDRLGCLQPLLHLKVPKERSLVRFRS